MKIAIYNEFINESFAEAELTKRICLAAKNLGWEAIEVGSSTEVKHFNPDFVLVLHFKTPKLTGFPTYGCMWNPIDFFEAYEIAVKKEKAKENILSYDGYLSSSLQVNTWLEDLLYGTNKNHFISPFYTSCHQTAYRVPNLDNSQLVYIGTNWDGLRFQDLFQYLDTKEYMEIYGPQNAWKYLNNSYKGSIPFDGISILSILNNAGIGLCLHKEEHTRSAIPSMRIFEIVSSGALAICEEHPFIREAFGDSVFYIDPMLNPSQKVSQISKCVRWIKNNRQEALEMSANAHRIFIEKYSLEKLLLGIVPHHQKLIKEKGFVRYENALVRDKQRVEIIVRVGGRQVSFLKRCLNSIVDQTYNNVGVVVVKYRELEGLDDLLTQYKEKIPIKLVETEFSGFRSTQLAAGINAAVDSEYFGILDDDDLIHPNHISSLVSILEKFDNAGVAYSGSIRVWEDNNDKQFHKWELAQEKAELAYFEPFDINKILSFDNFIVSNSFIARSCLIDENMKKDYNLKVAEDMFLLLNLCRKAKFIFSYEATCEFYWRYSKTDNSSFENDKYWEDAVNRLKCMFWKKEFPASSRMLANIDKYIERQNPQLQDNHLRLELEYARQVIKAMQTSKFWQLRNLWLNLRKKLGLPINEQLI